MNFANFKIVSLCIKTFLCLLLTAPAWGWEVDLSRRKTDFERIEDRSRQPASVDVTETFLNIQKWIEPALPVQDVVILNTENGFVPDRLHLRKGQNYRVTLVNLNQKKRNISFILDDFAENHATPYAEGKAFEIKPQKTGEFVFHSPETTFRGRMIVVDPSSTRTPASQK